jgi:hypothetical protein
MLRGALDAYLPEDHQGSYGDGDKSGDGAGRGNGGFEPIHPPEKEKKFLSKRSKDGTKLNAF